MNRLVELILLILFCIPVGCKGKSRPSDSIIDYGTENVSDMGKSVWFYDPWLQMDALKIETPAGWKAACDIVWDFNNPATPCRFWLKAVNADNTKGVEIFPMEQYTWSQHTMQYYGPGRVYLGSVVMQPIPALNFLQQLVITKFRGSMQQLRIVKAQQVPVPQPQNQQHGITQQCDGAEVIVTYINPQGKAITELFTCALQYTVVNNSWTWLPLTIMSKKEPADATATDRQELDVVIASIASNPQWISRQADLRVSIAQGARQNIVNTSEAARRYAQQGAQARAQKSSYFEERMASSEKISKGWDDVRMGNERFVDPSGNEHVESTYRAQGWINGLGQTVYAPGNSTYNPNFDPSLSGDWSKLKVK